VSQCAVIEGSYMTNISPARLCTVIFSDEAAILNCFTFKLFEKFENSTR
jgi:hypothetical protein